MPITARVVAQHRDAYELESPLGHHDAVVSGQLRHLAHDARDLPVVGDLVTIEPVADGTARIDAIGPRRALLVRTAAGSEAPQPIAANLDETWILTALDRDLNPRRLERYLAAVWESGSTPVVVLTKADLCEALEPALALVASVTAGVDVHVVSAHSGEGLDLLAARRRPGMLVGLVGSSGVGKSSLVNLWRTEVLETREVSANERGRHTTTARHLYTLDDGSCVVDTPGMREFGLFDADSGLLAAFPEIEALAAACRFADCGHGDEPGCAVVEALGTEALSAERFSAWRKLVDEQAAYARRTDPEAMRAHKADMKARQRALKAHYRLKR